MRSRLSYTRASDGQAHSALQPLLDLAVAEREAVPIWFIGENETATPLSAGRLFDDARSRAGWLAAAGVEPRQWVLLVASDPVELIQLFLGCVACGAVPAIYPAQRHGGGAVAWPRVAALIESAGFAACVVTGALADEAAAAGIDRLCRLLRADGLTAVPLDWCAAADGPCFVQLTSGSAGLPKAIPHTHERIRRYLDAKWRAMRMTGDDIVASWLPLYHDLGLMSGVFSALGLGVRTVLMSPLHWVRAPAALLRAITTFRATMCFMPNFAYAHLTRAVRERDLTGVDLASVRTLACGGEPVRAETLDGFRERFSAVGLRPDVFCAGYGMAEMVEGATATRPDVGLIVDEVDRAELEQRGRVRPACADGGGARRVVSCGPPLPGCEIRIVDAAREPVAERVVGEILLRSDYMLEDYAGDAVAALVNGWLATGDLGYLSGGELYVVGRSKDIIIVGGRNIAPDDVEALAEDIDGLRPGRCVALGIADDETGTERPLLICECDAGDETRVDIERELRRRARERLDVALGGVAFVATGWIAKTSSGKLARAVNRRRYLDVIAEARR